MGDLEIRCTREVIRDPVNRFVELYESWDDILTIRRLSVPVYMRCPQLFGIPIRVSNLPRRANIGSVLLAAQRLGYLGDNFQATEDTKADFIHFFATTTGYFVSELWLIPGYGQIRPWTSRTVDDMRDFYTFIRRCSRDRLSSVCRTPYSDVTYEFGFLLQFLF